MGQPHKTPYRGPRTCCHDPNTRTDAERDHVSSFWNQYICEPRTAVADLVPAAFAEELERELAAAQAENKRVAAELARLLLTPTQTPS